MSETHIPASLRRVVLSRAAGLCEYCLISDEDTFFGGQIDHVIHLGTIQASEVAETERTAGELRQRLGKGRGFEPRTLLYLSFVTGPRS